MTKKICVVATILIFVFYFARIFALEQDLSPWGIGVYQPADEGQYVLPAINEYNLGMPNCDNLEPYSSFVPYNLRTNVIGNALVLLGLRCIGDNYFGFRISSVILGFANLLLLCINLYLLIKISGKEKDKIVYAVAIGILAYLCIDFTFFNASIVVEPSIVRMLFAQTLLLIVLLTNNNGYIRYFLLSFVSMLGIGLVYFTNTFFLCACGLLLVFQCKKEGFKKLSVYGLLFASGIVAAACVAEIYYLKVWNSHLHENFINAISAFSNSTAYKITGVSNGSGIIKTCIKAVLAYFSSNPFFYCAPLLIATLLCLPNLVVNSFVCDDDIGAFLIVLPFSLLLQTLFTIDYISRKAVVVFPILCCLVFYCYLRRDVKNKDVVNGRFSKSAKCIYLIGVVMLVLASIAFRLFIVNDGTRLDFSKADKILVLIIGVLPCVCIVLICAYYIWREKLFDKKTLKLCLFILILPLCVSPAMTFRYFVLNRTYTEKTLMTEFGRVANEKYVVGSFVSGFTLYNDIKPITTLDEENAIYMQDNPELLLLGYEDRTEGARNYYDNEVFKGRTFSAYPVYEGVRNFQAMGLRRGFDLYTTMPKDEIVAKKRTEYENAVKAAQEFENIDDQMFKSLSTEERIQYLNSQKAQHAQALSELPNDPYPGIEGSSVTPLQKENIYVNIYGDINNDVKCNVYGNVYGNIRGDIYGTIYGNVYGSVYGKVYGSIEGKGDLFKPCEVNVLRLDSEDD